MSYVQQLIPLQPRDAAEAAVPHCDRIFSSVADSFLSLAIVCRLCGELRVCTVLPRILARDA
jgi:hypothetical protein